MNVGMNVTKNVRTGLVTGKKCQTLEKNGCNRAVEVAKEGVMMLGTNAADSSVVSLFFLFTFL
jgi:hypothetical protein